MLIDNMTMPLMYETVWFDKYKYDDAERVFAEAAALKVKSDKSDDERSKTLRCAYSLADEIASARQRLKNTLQSGDSEKFDSHKQLMRGSDLLDKITKVIADNEAIKKSMAEVESRYSQLAEKVMSLEKKIASAAAAETNLKSTQTLSEKVQDENDDLDLFGSDEEEDAAAQELREQRLKAYEDKKAKKKAVVAKSSVILDIKPWDDETDMAEMEKQVRCINTGGLTWGASKLVPLAYGIQKLQMVCIVEDEKVSIDWLQETIQDEVKDLVQSVDIAAFNKL